MLTSSQYRYKLCSITVMNLIQLISVKFSETGQKHFCSTRPSTFWSCKHKIHLSKKGNKQMIYNCLLSKQQQIV